MPCNRRPGTSPTNSRRVLVAVAALAVLLGTPARAARPLVDTGKLDGVFALYARDVLVPWKKPVVRLDTYSGAPVDFAAYEVDPTEVLVAGAGSRPRPIDTARMTAVTRWKFTPPSGFKFESNRIDVPLQNREGFFVVEARRGDASEQVWLNLTRIGLLTKESPEGLILYGTDLATGRPLRGMRITMLVGTHFTYAKTDDAGMVRAAPGPRFALAEWGKSRAFVSLVPQSPLPAALVGVRTERGVVRAGDNLRVVGFARRRVAGAMRPLAGDVHVSLIARGRSVASTALHLDASGGFSGEVAIPAETPAGDLAVLAQAGGATGGSTVHVDAAGDVRITVAAACANACAFGADVPVHITATRAGTPVPGVTVAVHVVRTPHVLAPGEADDAERWGTTAVLALSVRTGADGSATIAVPAPTDGLSSTYGVIASTASTAGAARIVVANATTVVAISPDAPRIDIGHAASFNVRAFDPTDGKPAAGGTVTVRLTKGPDTDQVTVKLDNDGRGRASFRSPALGTNIAYATLADDPRALDATAVTVLQNVAASASSARDAEITVALDRDRYKAGDRATVTASLPGASGNALVTVEGARIADVRLVDASSGRIQTSVNLAGASGAVRIGVAFVRDGAILQSSVPVAIDGPGYPRVTALSADRGSYAPGSTARISVRDGEGAKSSMLAIRISDGRPSGGAAFDDAPAILAVGGTSTQNPASDDPAWHAYVQPARSTAVDVFSGERPRPDAGADANLAVAAPRALLWKIDRIDREAFDVTLPAEKGRYIVSVLKISDDGDVGAASLAVTVQ